MKNIRLTALRLQFTMVDFLSNFRCFHRFVLDKKIYLGAAILSLNLIGSSCTNEPNKNKSSIPEKPIEENIDEQTSCYDTIAPPPTTIDKNDSIDNRQKKR